MAISKPSWLRNALDHLNWDILTWHVYVGDAIESGIDWVIDWINWAITEAEDAWNKAVDAWDKAVDVFWDLTATINREVSRLWNNIEVWWDDLGDWWSTRVTLIKGWIEVVKQSLTDVLSLVNTSITALSLAWDNFWENTWPQLLKDFNSLLVNVGNFFAGILPGLATLLNVLELIKSAFAEREPFWAGWQDIRDQVFAFFTDPVDWLWGKLVDYLERHW